MYDIFYVSRGFGNDSDWEKIKSKYSYARRLQNVKSFNDIKNKTFTKMFWVIWDDLSLSDNFDLINYRASKWDDMYVHIFKNGEHKDGICLFPKNIEISQKEFDNRFFISKKEIDIIASYPNQYKKYRPSKYEEYLEIQDENFWIVWDNVEILDESVFDLYFSYHNSYDRKENHIFKNSCYGKESYINGVFLCSKHKKISKREFDIRYLIDKKEHNIVASRSKYPIFKIDSYDEYISALDQTKDDMFWAIWPEIEVIDDSVFEIYFDPRDGKYDYDRNINHVFLHHFKEKEYTYHNGLALMSAKSKVGKREIDFRYLINKKEQEIVATKHSSYDIVFISYKEPNADENWQKLKERFPDALRVHGVKGIHQAHIKAAEISESDMIWVVDGDAVIVDDFNFDYPVTGHERRSVHVWRSQNPINDLVYGYGGVKLLPRKMTLNMDVNSTDMTTSIGEFFKVVDKISNITAFNTDPYNTWKSAFRECVKLSSRVISKQNEEETLQRLTVWTTEGKDRPYGEFAIRGAIEGREFGTKYKEDPAMLSKINDFEWLREYYGRN